MIWWRPVGQRQPRRTRGNALVEFVLVLPFFLMLVLGAVDWGWYFAVREVAINATRQGARVGAASPGSAVDDAQAAVLSYLEGSLGPAYKVTPAAAIAGAAPAQRIVVSLTDYPVVPSPRTSLTGLSSWTRVPAKLTAQTEMRLEVQPGVPP